MKPEVFFHVIADVPSVYTPKKMVRELGSFKALLLSDLLSLFKYLLKERKIAETDYMLIFTKKIANDFGVNQETVKRAIRDLAKRGYIKKKIVGSPPILAIEFNFDSIAQFFVEGDNNLSQLGKDNFSHNTQNVETSGIEQLQQNVAIEQQNVVDGQQNVVKEQGRLRQSAVVNYDKVSQTNNIIANNIIANSNINNNSNFSKNEVTQSADNQRNITHKDKNKKETAHPGVAGTKPQKVAKKKKVVIEFPLWWDDELQELWDAYLEMRKKIKRPATDYAKKLAIDNLRKLSKDNPDRAKKVLEQSISNSWQGLYEYKTEMEKKKERDLKKELKRTVGGTLTRAQQVWSGADNPETMEKFSNLDNLTII